MRTNRNLRGSSRIPVSSGEVFLTGGTGKLGRPLLKTLLGDPLVERVHLLARSPDCVPSHPKLRIHAGDLRSLGQLPLSITHIVHLAALTDRQASETAFENTNVNGTLRLLRLAKRCPKLRRFLYLSSTGVAGDHTGLIREKRVTQPRRFTNAYEASKWRAEHHCLEDLSLPVIVLRLAPVLGSVHGLPSPLFQKWIQALSAGALTLLPDRPEALMDFVSTEYAVELMLQALFLTDPPQVIHGSMGERAAKAEELLALLKIHFVASDKAWASGLNQLPRWGDQTSWHLFQKSVDDREDHALGRLLEDTKALFPTLWYPRSVVVSKADRLCFCSDDWRDLAKALLAKIIPQGDLNLQNTILTSSSQILSAH